MALDFKVEFCHREADGTLTMRVQPMAEGQPFLKSIEIQGRNATELETKLRPLMQAVKAKYDEQNSLTAIAQARVTALKTELGIV